jgi:hypothetical protein
MNTRLSFFSTWVLLPTQYTFIGLLLYLITLIDSSQYKHAVCCCYAELHIAYLNMEAPGSSETCLQNFANYKSVYMFNWKRKYFFNVYQFKLEGFSGTLCILLSMNPSLLYNRYRVFQRGKAAGAWCWPHTPSSAEVMKGLLYLLYSPWIR